MYTEPFAVERTMNGKTKTRVIQEFREYKFGANTLDLTFIPATRSFSLIPLRLIFLRQDIIATS